MRKDKKDLPEHEDCLFQYYIRKDRRDVNTRLKKFCKQKNISFIGNSKLKEEHLGL